jgi:C4-type Zn-finger protein
MSREVFDSLRPCSKCHWMHSDVKYFSNDNILEDYLIRTCKRCGYKWEEIPRDREDNQ